MEKLKDQLTLESEMSTLGLIRYRAKQQRARERSQPWATDAAREYTARLIVTIAERIETRIDLMKNRPGSVPEALTYLALLEPRVIALLLMRSALNSVMRLRSITRASVMVGGEIEREARYHQFRAAYPGLFETIKNRIKNSTSPGYKHKVISQAMRSTSWEYEAWTEETKLRVGAVLLDILVTLGVVERKHPLLQRRGKKGPILTASSDLDAWLVAYDEFYELLSPLFLPCIVPPKEWTAPNIGGYYSQELEVLPLVKGTTRNYLKELEKVHMPLVYEGINYLQQVGWSVYPPMLSTVEEHWHLSREVGTLPSAEDKPLPSKPSDIERNRESRVAWKRKAAAVWELNIRTRSKRIAAMQIITTGKRYGEDTFYYPHQMDFRGRVYTVPHPLTVQGSDLCRGLLQFSEALPIETDEAARWLAIHGANAFGYDKVSFEDRVKWSVDNTSDIQRCAEDPYNNRWWLEADDPWQFLRWSHDWVGLHGQGLSFRSQLPISVDQTCSGLQHYAALLRDPVSGKSTNLMPSSLPNDIYSDVAEAVTKRVTERMDEEFAPLWLQFGVDRSVLKRIVMTTPYGSKKYSHRTFIVDAINAKGGHPFGDQVPEAAQWLANVTWDTIGEVVIAARVGMDWLREVARVIVKSNQALRWTTPLGFPVEQNYEAMQSRQIRLSLGDGSSCKATLKVPATNRMPDVVRQINGVAPNVIHSLDATVLLLAVVKAKAAGIQSIGVVHDSFSSHACNIQKLGEIIRSAFVEVYRNDILKDLHSQFQAQTDKPVPPLPTYGTLDIEQVLQSPYFAG